MVSSLISVVSSSVVAAASSLISVVSLVLLIPVLIPVVLGLVLVVSCTVDKGPLGSEKNPVKVFLIPSVDAQMLKDKAQGLKEALEERSGYNIKLSVPSSYIAVVEAFGTKKADVAIMNTFGYLLAHRKYGVEAKLMVTRFGRDTYRSQIITHVDSGISNLEDLNGKKFGYVDPSSASGHLLAKDLFRKKGIKLGQTMFAQKHDSVVTMVYQKQVDGGATFYSPERNGKIQDARRLVRTQFPDVEDKVKILSLTESIPNDPIIFRKGLDKSVSKKLIDAFLAYVKTNKGQKTFEDLYLVDGLIPVTDEEYDKVRELFKNLNQ